MAINNSINNTLQPGFFIGVNPTTVTAAEVNLLTGLTLAPITRINVRVLTSSGTYTPTSGTRYIYVKGVGGGGSGGGSGASAASQFSMGSGGGSGGECAVFTSVPASPVSYSVGAGALSSSINGTQGGTTSFGTYFSLTGGSGGTAGTTTAGPQLVGGGLGGGVTASSPVYQSSGQKGFSNIILNASQALTGSGGSSTLGPGGPYVGAALGTAGQGPGAGGSGGGSYNAGGANSSGAGAAGTIIVTEYISE